jgi:ParB family chromosome partitioning protein
MNTRRHVAVFDRPASADGDLDAASAVAPLDGGDLPATATARDNPATSIKGAAQGRSDLFRLLPDQIVIVTDKTHPLYDERVSLPLSEPFVASIMEHGILKPVLIRKNGELFECVDGRQRVRAAIEVNRRKAEAGDDRPILVPVVMRRDNNLESAKIMVAANEIRAADTPIVRARKAQRLLNMGALVPEVANQFGLTVDHLNDLLKVLETSEEVQHEVAAGTVPATAASAIAALPRDEQRPAMEELRAQGLAVTRANVSAKVKAKREAKRTGAPEREVTQAPRKKLIQQVIDAYAADDRQASQVLAQALIWATTGSGVRKIPGPKGHDTLYALLRAIEKGEV